MKLKKIDLKAVVKDRHPKLRKGDRVLVRLKGRSRSYVAGKLSEASFYPKGSFHMGLHVVPTDGGDHVMMFSPVDFRHCSELYVIQD